MTSIQDAMKPARRRLMLIRALRGAIFGLLAGFIACAALRVGSFFVPIGQIWIWYGLALAICIVSGAMICACMRPNDRTVAKSIDNAGLKERVQTIVEFQQSDEPMLKALYDDALNNIKRFTPSKGFPISLPRRSALMAGVVAVLVAASYLIPNPQDAIAAQQTDEKKAAHQAAEILEKEAEKPRNAKINEKLAELAEKLRESRSSSDALKEISKAQEQLTELEQQDMKERMQRAADALDANKGGEGIGDALDSQDMDALSQALQDMLNEALNDPEAAKELEELAKELAEQAKKDGDTDLQKAMEELANIASQLEALSQSTNSAAVASALQQAAGQITNSMGQGLNSQYTSMQSALAAARAALTRQARQAQQGGAGQGQGQGQGQGEGEGQGIGNGNGQNGGNGASTTGSGQVDRGYFEGGPRNNSEGTAPGSEREATDFERIYDPSRLGGQGNETSIAGSDTGEGDSQIGMTAPGQGTLDGSVPYQDVLGDYQREATRAMDRDAVPESMRDYVQRYFTGLN